MCRHEVRARERELAALQVRLLRSTDRQNRQHLLDRIFLAEAQLAPVATELFNRTRAGPRKPLTLADVQRALRSDEVFLEFALADPASYCVVVTRTARGCSAFPAAPSSRRRLSRAEGRSRWRRQVLVLAGWGRCCWTRFRNSHVATRRRQSGR